MKPEVTKRLVKKALTSRCNQKVAAIALSKKGDYIGSAVNSIRMLQMGGGKHAERELMKRFTGIKTIILGRVNKSGELLPIHPCSVCSEISKSLGITIISVWNENKFDLVRKPVIF